MKIYYKIFFVLTVLGILYWFLFDFLRWDMFDSASFVGAAKKMFSLEGGYNEQSRLSKPLALFLPGFLEFVFGLDAHLGFIIQSIIAYYISGFLIFNIILNLSSSHKIAFAGLIAYLMCQSVAIYSFMILVDNLGWMINLLVINMAILEFRGNSTSFSKLAFLGFISSMGFLIKESAVFGLIFLCFYIVFQKQKLSRILKDLILVCGIFAAVFSISHLLTGVFFNDTILSRVAEQQNNEGFVFYNKNNLPQLFRVLDFYWVLFLIGLLSMSKWIQIFKVHREAKAFLFSITVSLLFMPVYPFVVDRIMFMVAPGLVFFVALSMVELKTFGLPLIFIGGILNILVTWLIYKYNIQGLLMWVGLGYGFLVAMVWVLNHKSGVLLQKTWNFENGK